MASRPVTRTGTSSSRQAGEHREHDGRPGHVGLHAEHAVDRLDLQATGVERDALADEHDPRRGGRRARRARGRGAPAAAGWPSPGPTARMPPKPSRAQPALVPHRGRRGRCVAPRCVAWRASQAGFLVFDGVAASPRATSWARARATARCTATASPVPVTTAVGGGLAARRPRPRGSSAATPRRRARPTRRRPGARRPWPPRRPRARRRPRPRVARPTAAPAVRQSASDPSPTPTRRTRRTACAPGGRGTVGDRAGGAGGSWVASRLVGVERRARPARPGP